MNNICASVLGDYVFQCVCASAGFAAAAYECVKMPWVENSAVRVRRETASTEEGFKYFLSVGGKKPVAEREQQQMINCTSFFFFVLLPSLSHSISSTFTLSDIIPTLRLHCAVAVRSISGDASLEKNMSCTVSFYLHVDHMEPNQHCRGETEVCYSE